MSLQTEYLNAITDRDDATQPEGVRVAAEIAARVIKARLEKWDWRGHVVSNRD